MSSSFGVSEENVDFDCFLIPFAIEKWWPVLLFKKFSYLYEVSRRHPYFYGPELLYYVKKYKAILTECCQAADKATCLAPKVCPRRRMKEPVRPQTSDLGHLMARLGNLSLWYKLLDLVEKSSSHLSTPRIFHTLRSPPTSSFSPFKFCHSGSDKVNYCVCA